MCLCFMIINIILHYDIVYFNLIKLYYFVCPSIPTHYYLYKFNKWENVVELQCIQKSPDK